MKSDPEPTDLAGYSRSQTDADLYLYWAETWNKAVAESWRDPEFAKALVADPKKALFEKYGFVFKEKVEISVVQVAEGATDPDGRPYGWTDGANGPAGWNLPGTKVQFFLPPAPAASEQAVAVMAYWETGEALPFSCGCF